MKLLKLTLGVILVASSFIVPIYVIFGMGGMIEFLIAISPVSAFFIGVCLIATA